MLLFGAEVYLGDVSPSEGLLESRVVEMQVRVVELFVVPDFDVEGGKSLGVWELYFDRVVLSPVLEVGGPVDGAVRALAESLVEAELVVDADVEVGVFVRFLLAVHGDGCGRGWWM